MFASSVDFRLSLDFFDSGLYTRTAVARLTLALAKLSCFYRSQCVSIGYSLVAVFCSFLYVTVKICLQNYHLTFGHISFVTVLLWKTRPFFCCMLSYHSTLHWCTEKQLEEDEHFALFIIASSEDVLMKVLKSVRAGTQRRNWTELNWPIGEQ